MGCMNAILSGAKSRRSRTESFHTPQADPTCSRFQAVQFPIPSPGAVCEADRSREETQVLLLTLALSLEEVQKQTRTLIDNFESLGVVEASPSHADSQAPREL